MRTTATIRPLLSQTCSEYASNLEGQFMGLEILPPSMEDHDTGTFSRLVIENVTGGTGTGRRAPGAGYERTESTFEETNYTTKEYGLEEPLDDSEAERYRVYLNAEREIANTVTYKLARLAEQRIATKVFNATTFSGYTGAVSTEWSTASTANPYNDVQDAILTLKQQMGGALGNSELCLAMSEKVFRNTIKTTAIQNKIMGGSGSMADETSTRHMIGANRLAAILGVDKVFYSPAQAKSVAGTLTDVWDDEYALLYFRNTGMNLREVQIGRTFMWNEAGNPYTVETYRDEPIRSEVIRVRHHCDENVFTPMAGYLFSNITT